MTDAIDKGYGAYKEITSGLRSKLNEARIALDDAKCVLDDYADVIDGPNGPLPNCAMQMARELDEIIARLAPPAETE